MNIVEHVSLLKLEHLLGICTGEVLLDLPVVLLRKRQTDFQSGYTRLKSHQQWRSTPFSSYPCQYLLSAEFLILAILTGVRWNLRVILICISLMTKDVEKNFRYFSPFDIPQLKILCLALYPVFNRIIWFFGV